MPRCAEGQHYFGAATEGLHATRYAGGNYRRPGRWYDSTICVPCALEVMAYVERMEAEDRGVHGKVGAGKWSRTSLERALERWKESRDADEA